MTQQMYAVFDNKAAAYLSPFTTNTHGVAERMFTELVNQDGHQFNRFPEDYTLYHIGTWETETAQLLGKEPVPIMTATGALRSLEAL